MTGGDDKTVAKLSLIQLANPILKQFGFEIVRSKQLVDFYLHEYKSYEEYRDVQIKHNMRKISSVWADEATLQLLCSKLREAAPPQVVI